ncbi:MAG: serine protease Do [Pseudohongiellaceae bacterium]|jgi:serine protease Do
MRHLRLFLLVLLCGLLGACISYEPRLLPPAISFSAEQVSLTTPASSDRLLDFGLQLSQNESDSLFNIEILPGVRVRAVSNNGPAASAGIQVGDVILRTNGLATDHPDAFNVLAQTEQSTPSYTLEVRRDTTVFETQLTPRRRPANSQPVELYRLDPIATRAGYRTEMVTVDGRGPVAGAKVVAILAKSPLPAAGISADDLVLAVNGREINSAQDLINRLNQDFALGSRVSLTVFRDSQLAEVELRLWNPGRRINRISLGPLLNYQTSLETDSTALSLIDLWLFSFYSYQRSESEKSHSVLGLLNFSTDVGELTEE